MIIFLFLQIEWQIINRPYNDSSQELVVHFTIPTHELKFIAEDSFYYVHYENQLKIFEKNNNQLTGDYWRVKRLKDSLDIRDSVLIVIPKTSDYYNFKIVDLNGGVIFNITEKIIPINYVGNIKWVSMEDVLYVTFSVLNQKGDVDSIFSSLEGIKKGLMVHAGIYDDSLSFFVKELPNDFYNLKFEIFSAHKKIDEVEIPVKISRPFFLDDVAWSLKVSQLRYIATSSEMDQLKKVDEAQRDSLWKVFWKQYDPTPSTIYNEREVEYFLRIEYCEKNFSHGDKGWCSDRAKIYVVYGQADEIQCHPYEIHSRPHEVWFYYRFNRKFIFVDQYGIGEYILAAPQGSTI